MAGPVRSIELSVRVYQALVKAYPPSFYKEFGGEMALVFREYLTDTWRRRGGLGLATAWLGVLGDLARTVPQEHFRRIERRMDMRRAALAVLSAVLAVLVYYAIFFGIFWIAVIPFCMDIPRSVQQLAMLGILYLSAILTGLILARVKPFFVPAATVPLALMAIWAVVVLANILGNRSPEHALGWGGLVLQAGFVASVGLVSLLGCVVGRRGAHRLARFSVPWLQLVGPLAVLVCTSHVACVLRLVLVGNQIGSDLQRILTACLFSLLVIGVLTATNIVILFVRAYQKAAGPVPERPAP
jgi:hypothetical protein